MGPDRTRIATLDGLRGVAAFVVVICHVLVASSDPFNDAVWTSHDARFPSLTWWLQETPLQVVWSGQAAVLTFFVLSGYVLALPYARGARFSAPGYYVKRLLRLYLPVWGALLVALALHLAVERVPLEAGTDWLTGHVAELTREEFVQGALLVDAPGGRALLTVLWTLKWEVLFSLLLPLYLLVARRATSVPAAALVAVACVIVMYKAPNPYAGYLPCFMFGTLLAFQRDLLARTARLVAARRSLRLALPAACLLLLTVGWWVETRPLVAHIAITLGATLAVALAVVHGGIGRALRAAPVQWTGRRSFSLYLVHEPVIIATAFALRESLSPLLLLALGVPLALLASDLFFRAIERPSHRLSRAAGRRLAERARDPAVAPGYPA